MVRFVYFDAAFTLLEPWPSVGYHYSRIAARFDVDVPERALDEAFRPGWKKALKGVPPGSPPYGRTIAEARAFWTGVVTYCFQEAGHTGPLDPQFHGEVFDAFATGQCWRVYGEVWPALEVLKNRGIRCGVLSNWDLRLSQVLKATGLSEHLEIVLSSSSLGVEKPQAEAFRMAEKACGWDSSEIALVGDDPETDGIGAAAAGWHYRLVNREFPGPTGETFPDLVSAVESLLS